jgi:hypothetical protein
MEQHALKSVNNCMNTNIYSYLDTSGSQSSGTVFTTLYFHRNLRTGAIGWSVSYWQDFQA